MRKEIRVKVSQPDGNTYLDVDARQCTLSADKRFIHVTSTTGEEREIAFGINWTVEVLTIPSR